MTVEAPSPRPLIALLATAALAACAHQATAPDLAATPPSPSLRVSLPVDDRSTLGLYLAAETALDAGDSEPAARFFARASASDPMDADVRERAFTTNLLAGQVQTAARLAPEPGASAADPVALGRLVRGVELLARGDASMSATLLKESAESPLHAAAAALVLPWAQAAAPSGKPPPLPAPPPGADATIGRFAALGRARLLERAGDLAGAEAAFKPLVPEGRAMFAEAYGGFLERRGRRAEAVALYDAALKRDDDAGLRLARARAVAKAEPPPQPTPRQGAAESLIGPAASQIGAKRADLGLIYVRLALRLDPELAQAWLVVGDTLTAAGELAGAKAAYLQIKEDSPEGPAALERLALAAQTAKDKPEALRLARRAYTLAPNDDQAGVVLAEILRTQERFDEAVAVLDPLVARTPSGDAAARLLFMRGAAHERAGRWPQAEADLQKALAIRPDDSEVLNYLGFGWADRGLHLKEALAMLERAHAAQPDQGAVLDSLGWARFHMGDLKGAVRDLERAAALEPSDPEINDHLGDAYQRVGRGVEARYQWRRVLTLEPETRTRTGAEAKLRAADAAPAAAQIARKPAA